MSLFESKTDHAIVQALSQVVLPVLPKFAICCNWHAVTLTGS